MLHHTGISPLQLRSLIKNRDIACAGNKQLYIYGKLSCRSGKKMNKENRVFFKSAEEALQNGYRPCAHCMRKEYKEWKFSCKL
ncbi:metal-binding protein [Panacibacter sp. DH6]|uniref:Metal-binding protein n=1 Tax=Panacibacter microcysteis TaxID=2793269 RepID=A0A931E839_9BACT|nr:Ada metal-binding domain-containing protein [Panacibacter microcysteis]MBG9377121.1 metal-binding protein [Panacibacter microcysteis]